MALLAEELVEEWLNRSGFFTIRGIKEGVGEIDLLAVRPNSVSPPEGWHVEVQVGFRPVTYMTNLTPRLAKSLNKAPGSAFRRSPEMLAECVAAWIRKKFDEPRKVKQRERLWPGIAWKPVLVHGVFKFRDELSLIESKGVALIPLRRVLTELSRGRISAFTAASGDLAELIGFYAEPAEGEDSSV